MRGCATGRLEAASSLDADMQMVAASKASIRISVPAVDFTTGGVAGHGALAEGLRACERLAPTLSSMAAGYWSASKIGQAGLPRRPGHRKLVRAAPAGARRAK